MLTFFTTAKPFQAHSAIIQRNALKSWRLLHQNVEVIVFGDEEGTAEVCAELGFRHEAHVDRHESGMKYLHSIFARAQTLAVHDYLCYSNCDIVLTNDFREAVEKAIAWRPDFLLVAQRWDLDVTNPIEFDRPEWAQDIRTLARRAGRLQVPDFIDFFVFKRGLYDAVPPMLIGRSHWDHWLVWKALDRGFPVVDGTPFVVPVHQNHEYGYHPLGKQGTNEDALARRNVALAADGKHLRSILDSTHRMTRYGKIRRTRFRRQLESERVLKVRQAFVEGTFRLRDRLGLRRATLDRLLGHTDK